MKRLGDGREITVHELINHMAEINMEPGQCLPIVIETDAQTVRLDMCVVSVVEKEVSEKKQ